MLLSVLICYSSIPSSPGDAVFFLNVALTLFAPFMVTVQVPVPLHMVWGVQPAKVEPDAGVAVSVTCRLYVKEPVQVAPQSMPAGELTTVPSPPPTLFLVTVRCWGPTNTAVTFFAAFRVTVQVPVEQVEVAGFQP